MGGDIYALLEAEVRDRSGELKYTHRQYSHSFVLNFFRALRALFVVAVNGTGETLTNTAGNGFNYPALTDKNQYVLKVNAGVGDISHGIVVGTGTDPTTINTIKLVSPITHGTGTGQLYYDTVGVEYPAVAGSTAFVRIYRYVYNKSSSSITVNEVGLIASSYNGNFLIARDVLSQPVTLAPGDYVAFRYIITT